jgi:orotidine-5'-phosphate decarboxylase
MSSSLDHFADRLAAAVRAKKTPLCVGLDPRWDQLPAQIRKRHGGDTLPSIARAYEEFCARVLDVVASQVAVVKPQSAFFEACGPRGMTALTRSLERARRVGLLSILDAKRNDIASTGAAYADAALAGVTWDGRTHPVWDADALTINPYLGRDAVEPFIDAARRSGRGIFVLVRTSNPGARQFQDLDCAGKPLYVHVAQAVGAWAGENQGKSGFGLVGAVIGATYPAELASLRQMLPNVFFLIPGYGEQGGGAKDVAGGFRADGLGAVVNSSRGIIFSFEPDDANWEAAVATAASKARADLALAAPGLA